MYSLVTGRSLAGHAAIIAGAFAVSRVLGMLREVVIAARFGTGETLDAYNAAFRIPDLLFVIVMSGAFGSAFIPVFGGFLARGDEERAWRLANALLTWTVVILLLVAQLILVFAEPLVAGLIAPELSPAARDLAVDLTRLLLLSPLLLGLGAAAKGMLEAQDMFTLPAVAPIVYNVGIILGALLLSPSLGIHGLVAGVIAGAAGHAGIQFAWLLRHGLAIRPTLSLRVEGLREVARLVGPRLAGQFVSQSNLIVMTNFASRAGDGAISALSYGQQLVMLPHGILALSLSTVIFPRMVRQFELGELGGVRQTLLQALRPLIFLTIPAAVMFFTLRQSIVQVVLQYGNFTAESTTMVVDTIAWFALGLLARSIIEPLTRTFYAMHDTRTPLLVSTLAVVLNVGLSWFLLDRMGLAGLALSLSLSSIVRMLVLLGLLARRTPHLIGGLARPVARMVPATLVLLVLGWAIGGPVARVTDPAEGGRLWGYPLFIFAVMALGAAYVVTARLCRVPEVTAVLAKVRTRVGRGTPSA
ncbi:MAG: murein biosynthesis integral membrane protein MurJ [Chloroflexia bacterium]|nr:murein biosynthesis integral membrane protein MurJ [Chloroflexia bacterium]